MSHVEELERELVEAVAGDHQALARLLVEYAPQLSQRIEQRLAFNPFADFGADDVLQEVFVDVVRGIGNFRGDCRAAFSVWLTKVADHRTAAMLRHHRAHKRGGQAVAARAKGSATGDLFGAGVEVLADEQMATASNGLQRDELVASMHRAIDGLPSEQREAVLTRFIEERSLESTAGIMNKSPAAVRGLIHRAKRSMQAVLGRSSRWFYRK